MHSTKQTTNKSNCHYLMVENGYQPAGASSLISERRSSDMLEPATYQQQESEMRYTVLPTNTLLSSKTPNSAKEGHLKPIQWNKKSSEFVSFIPPKGENCVQDLQLKKDIRTTCEKGALYSAFVGLTFVLSALVW